jgi:E3 ubiquitin-protein ligase RNF144
VCLEEEQQLSQITCGCNVCTGCAAEMVRIHVDEGTVDAEHLRCPDCMVPLTAGVIEELLRSASADEAEAAHRFERYHRLLLLRFVEGNTDTIVQCPTAGCEFVFERDEDAFGAIRCPSCTHEYCIQCLGPVHATEACPGSQLNSEVGGEPGPVASEDVRQCPKCRAWIEKDQGTCDKMQCRCGYRFCFQCGAEDAKCNCTPDFHQFWDNHHNRPVPPMPGAGITHYSAHNFYREW